MRPAGLGAVGRERAGVWQEGEDDDQGDEGEGGKNVEAALGAGAAAREEWAADGMGGEQMVSDHGAAVGDTEEEGLRPVPGGVQADRPPQGAGAPEAEGEEEADKGGGEEADGALARVGAVAEAEDGGEDQGGGPEAEGVGAVRGGDGAEEGGETAGEGVLEIAAEEELFKEADDQEAEGPDGGVAGDCRAGEQEAIEDEQVGLPEDEDQE